MAIVAIPLHVKTHVVDESVWTRQAQRRFGPPIWQADSPPSNHAEPLDRAALSLIVLAFSYADRIA
jgi:hypothetical protein